MKPDVRQIKPDIRQMKLDIRQLKQDIRQLNQIYFMQIKPDIRKMKPDIRQYTSKKKPDIRFNPNLSDRCRNYFQRRIRDAFKNAKTIEDAAAAEAELKKARIDLGFLQRQEL